MVASIISKALKKATKKKAVKKKPTTNLPNNYVKVPKKYLNTEQSILKKIDQNKPLTEKQMLNFSQAVKINEKAKVLGKSFEEGRNYVTKNQLNTTKGSITRAIKELGDLGYNPKSGFYFDKMMKKNKRKK